MRIELSGPVNAKSLMRHRLAFAAAGFVLITFAACSGGQAAIATPAMPSPAAGSSAPLTPGDAIRLAFSREPGLDGDYPIDETGTVSLPLLGPRLVTDRPAPTVKDALTQEFTEHTRNQAVQVVCLRRVRVLGEVRNPGLYRIDPTMSFDDVLAMAGGATNNGDLKNVSLIRAGVVLADKLDARRSINVDVHSDDQIYVPKTSWISRYGAVLAGATIGAVGAIIAWGLR